MSWTLCTSGAAIQKAGTHANSAIIASAALLAELSSQAEDFICGECHNDFVTNYAAISAHLKGMLASACSSFIAMDIASYDSTGYLTREADMIMNRNDEIFSQALAVLKVKQNQTLN